MMPRPSNLPPQSFSHFHSKAKINDVGLQKGSSAPASSRDLALKPGLKAWCVFCPLLFAGTAGGLGHCCGVVGQQQASKQSNGLNT
jgi:hypothetical protein